VHYGLVTVSDGKCRPQTSRLKLTPDFLVLQKEEFIFPDDDDGYPIDNKVWDAKLKKFLSLEMCKLHLKLCAFNGLDPVQICHLKSNFPFQLSNRFDHETVIQSIHSFSFIKGLIEMDLTVSCQPFATQLMFVFQKANAYQIIFTHFIAVCMKVSRE